MLSDANMKDVEMKIRKRRKILFSRDSLCLRDLFGCMQTLDHRKLVMWALDCAATPLRQFEMKYPQENRPRRCLEFCEKWARGEIKMPSAKQAILGAHAAAKDIRDDAYGALCHAIGHAGATGHVQTHAIGLPLYELTAIVLRCGKEEYARPVMDRINEYDARLLYWKENTDALNLEWADFLWDDAPPIK